MKNKLWAHFVLVVLISIGWTVCSQAMELIPVTSFDSTWVIDTYGTGTATVTTEGAKVNLSAQGTATDYGEKVFYKTGTTGVIGMWATLRVDQATTGSNGDCSIGISQYVGKVNNNKIQLMISLEQWTNQKRISFRVQATDLTTNVKTVLTQGTVGNWDGGWANGDSRTVAFARVGSEFWFYVVGLPGLIKAQPFDAVTSYDSAPGMFVWAGAGTSISGNVSDIYLIRE
ncbi:MAG: hypothetical protein HY881_07560 [Deltaproteobacteria bacterium]|nr:hypothetical protein [Deltaproteobacteria bacterium]